MPVFQGTGWGLLMAAASRVERRVCYLGPPAMGEMRSAAIEGTLPVAARVYVLPGWWEPDPVSLPESGNVRIVTPQRCAVPERDQGWVLVCHV